MESTEMDEIESAPLQPDDNAPTYTQTQALEIHQVAAANYKHVLKKVRSSVEHPSLLEIYRGVNRPSYAPSKYNLHVLFKNFNTIARGNYVAHPNLPFETNSIIFYYGFDKLPSFNFSLDMSRYNLFLAVVVLASKLVGRYDQKYDLSEHIWAKYIFAWIESVTTSPDEPDFTLRDDFLDAWRTSKYDLAWFTGGVKDRLGKIMKNMRAKDIGTETQCDPIAFLDQCRRGVISMGDFARDGPAMAVQCMFAQYSTAKTLSTNRLITDPSADNVRDTMQVDGAEHKIKLEAGEDCTNAMEIDDDMELIPYGIDLTEIPWHADWMQALLKVDRTIPHVNGYRPETDRIGWIDQIEAQKIFSDKEDGTLKDMMEVLNLSL